MQVVKGGKTAARTAKLEPDNKSRRYDPAETRTRVLEAAYVLFGTRGYSCTGTADIAAMADVSEGSIFYHFGSKRALLVELGRMHGQKMVAAMEAGEPLDTLSFEVSMNRCFDFCEVNNMWEEVAHDGDCPPLNQKISKKTPEAEPFFHAAKETVVAWTKAHLDAITARHNLKVMDTEIAANMIFALAGEALQSYFAPETTPEMQARIRAECIRFCTAAIGYPSNS
ncbi:TetR/AcrR family transcriptional regulator [Sandaracinobacteroides hominis]|uniref:TetR/AcrR family transcriptional regulator n=1 Tax=Sandaracinobacteroides hominis TaxID=2780086 RepID=UPI0018F74E76|nr:TetR/AcrR family transcriptional regulator [Sandaracinobacteroides hominis]